MTKVNILHLEGNSLDSDYVCRRLRRKGVNCDIHRVESRAEFIDALERRRWDLILSDYAVSSLSGEEALSLVRERGLDVPFILVSASRGDFRGTSAPEFVPKRRLERLVPAVLRAMTEFRERENRRRAEAALLSTEKELRLSRLRFDLVAHSIGIGMWSCEAPYRSLYCNEKSKEYLGLPPDAEVTFDLFRERVHPEDLERALRELIYAAKNGRKLDVEFRTLSPEGASYWIRAIGVPIVDETTKRARIDGICLNVTAEKRADKEREAILVRERAARSEAERISKMKDEFLATLSHELRTPLNAILGWSQLLKRGKVPPEELAKGMEIIERNTRLQAKLISDLLDMSRVSSGKVVLELHPAEPPGIITSVIETMRSAAEEKGLTIVAEMPESCPRIMVDAHRIEQVVANLLSNAVKFTPRGGRIEVTLSRCDRDLQLVVSDTGQGIAPEFMPYIFDRFRQADSSMTRRHGGLGLGLAIVRQLVELHGGRVAVTSPGPGEGATFTVTLPMVPPAVLSEDGDSKVIPHLSLQGIKVLVVDDDPDAQELARRLLENQDAKVTLAGSAKEALALLSSVRPDVLLSDIGMPEMDGYELIKRVRQRDPEHGGLTPAAALTAFTRSEDSQAAILAGYQEHLAKPAEPAHLIHTIARLAGLCQSSGG